MRPRSRAAAICALWTAGAFAFASPAAADPPAMGDTSPPAPDAPKPDDAVDTE